METKLDIGVEPELSLTEKRVDAMLALLSRADPECAALHRGLQEELRDRDYDALPYFEVWLTALRRKLVEAGLLDDEEIERRVAVIRERLAEEGRR